MGGTAEEMAAVTLGDWGEFAAQHCRALKAELGDAPVVLAGHSRGGLVISTAAERDPEAMDALVYICAMMLPSGVSRAEFKALEEPNPDFDAIISKVHGGVATVVDPARAGSVFAQISPPELVAGVLPRLLAEPHGPRSGIAAIDTGALGQPPAHLCRVHAGTGPFPSPASAGCRRCRPARGWLRWMPITVPTSRARWNWPMR